MDTSRHSVSFGSLPKVEDLLQELNFLNYSTQLRNTCYDIEYLFFLEEVLANDLWYGGFRTKLEFERLKVCFTVVESLLFCLLVSSGFLRENDHVRFPELVQKAVVGGFLDDQQVRKINELRRLRNQHHAGAQRDLQVKLYNTSNFNYAFILNLVHELKDKCV